MNTILICDDDDVMRSLMRETLLEEGYSVETVGDTSEAIEKLLERKFKAVILKVPGKDSSGSRAIPIINKISSTLPIITITDDPSLETQRKARGGKIFYYFTNPLDPGEIKEVVRNAISKSDKQ
jgi:DNA-binding NtrC family response regulator